MNPMLVGEPLALNREVVAAQISVTLVPHPKGMAILVPAVHEPIDRFLVYVTFREPRDTEDRFSEVGVIANAGWGEYRHDLRCEHLIFEIEPSMVRSVFIEPLRICGPVAAFSVTGTGLTGGVIGRG